MMRFRSLSCAALLLAAVTLSAAEPTLPELFNRVKADFSAGNFKEALADVDLLDAASKKPGLESERAKLTPVILFYRASSLAALNRKDEAKDTFISYLSYMPNASIATPPFPKNVVDAFQAAVKETTGKNNTLEALYARFVIPTGWSLAANEKWLESPVRYLMTSEQKKRYSDLTAAADREAFVSNFWAGYDPTPGTPQNEFRSEFEKRVAFADANFATTKLPGGATERGAVFTFLGVPNYIGVTALSAEDDVMGVLRATGNSDVKSGNSSRGMGMGSANRSGNDLESGSNQAMRESWYYRRNRLPEAVVSKEVRFEFITKEGYGTGVMQKDSNPMQALGQAVAAAQRDKKLN